MIEVQAVKRSIEILELFKRNVPEMSVTHVAQELSLSKATVARLMYTLMENEFLTKAGNSEHYRLGWKVCLLGDIFLSTINLREVALPFMKELNARMNETVDLCILSGHMRMWLERLESSYEVRPMSVVGRLGPLHAGAAGKVLLGFMPEHNIKTYLDKEELTSYTRNTITSKEALLKEIDRIKERGYAVSYEERVPLVNAVAAPIRDHLGKVVASLGISGLLTSFTPERMQDSIIPAVLKTASTISRELGYNNTVK
jgi:IclR family transcriptional regulator, KDG regulon repressor